jgi:hypothetical protein
MHILILYYCNFIILLWQSQYDCFVHHRSNKTRLKIHHLKSTYLKKKGESGRWETKIRAIEIVGGEESDMLSGKVSYKSPLGSALMGQVEDVEVSVKTPKGEIKYKIVLVD